MPQTLNKEFLIVDGSHYLYRAYYGVPETAKLPNGLQVNAVYGFMANLRKAVKFTRPSHIIVVFDSETGVKKKVEENASYKSNRNYNDVGMYKQLPLIKNILTHLEINFIEPADHEADDYIGFMAKHAVETGFLSTVFSNDSDFLQLIDNTLRVLKVGRSSLEIIDMETLQALFGFDAEHYVDYLSLKGDPSDNIKGVPGIGPKTAKSLINKYGTLKGIFNGIENLPVKTKESLINSKDLVTNNSRLLRINTNIRGPISNFDDYTLRNVDILNETTNNLLGKIGIYTK